MLDPMYFENYGEPVDFEVNEKEKENVLVPNYVVNIFSAIAVLATCAIVSKVAVNSFSRIHHAKRDVAATNDSSSSLLIRLDTPQDLNPDLIHPDWREILPSPRPIFCFVNREGFIRLPPDHIELASFPGYYCTHMIHKSLLWSNDTFELYADAIDDAILRQLTSVRHSLYPHWNVLANAFVGKNGSSKLQDPALFINLRTWLQVRNLDGVNLDFDQGFFEDDPRAAAQTALRFFANVKKSSLWSNITVTVTIPHNAAVILADGLTEYVSYVFIKTHGLLSDFNGKTQLAAPLDDISLIHHVSSARTVMSVLNGLEKYLNKKTCFTVAVSGISFTLSDPRHSSVGAAVDQSPPTMVSFSDVCSDGPGRKKVVEDDAVYSVTGTNWVTHEDQFTVFEKVAKILRHWEFMCIGVMDVDLDDVRGSCGRVFPLLQRIYETSYILRYY
ncbi:putative chitinase 2 [Ornithodoros turicata]|uniref:putative chitinase 2 n=1 Tax=Ornithodoros turicata TaxID=34597 RepID=UPI00313A3C98